MPPDRSQTKSRTDLGPLLGALVLAVSLGLEPADLAVICAYAAGFITANNPRRDRCRAVESII